MDTPPSATVAEALACSPLFAVVPVELRTHLAEHARRGTYARGCLLIRQGEPGDALYVLLTGTVKVLIQAETGDQALVAILGPGDCVGELSLLDGEPRSATIEAIDTVEALILPRADFLAVLATQPMLLRHLLGILAARIRHTSEVAADLAFLDVPGRVAKTLLALATRYGQQVGEHTVIDVQLTQTDVAAMVGATRESVSKQLPRFGPKAA